MLKGRGELSASDISEVLGITAVAVRKHLEALEAEGVVAIKRVPGARGRPTHLFTLTEAANSYFPRAYHQLAVDLLDELLASDGEEKLGDLFRARAQRLGVSYEMKLAGKDLGEKVRELARLRDEEGYMAVFERHGDNFVLRELNCPIFEIAQRHPAACNCEQELFSRVLRRDVRREARIVDGQAACEYHIGDDAEDSVETTVPSASEDGDLSEAASIHSDLEESSHA